MLTIFVCVISEQVHSSFNFITYNHSNKKVLNNKFQNMTLQDSIIIITICDLLYFSSQRKTNLQLNTHKYILGTTTLFPFLT